MAILQRQLEVYEQQRRKLEDYQAAAKRSQAQLDRISSLLPAAIAGHTGTCMRKYRLAVSVSPGHNAVAGTYRPAKPPPL